MKLTDIETSIGNHLAQNGIKATQDSTTKYWDLIIAGMSNSMLIENAWDDDGMPTTNTDQDAFERNEKA